MTILVIAAIIIIWIPPLAFECRQERRASLRQRRRDHEQRASESWLCHDPKPNPNALTLYVERIVEKGF